MSSSEAGRPCPRRLERMTVFRMLPNTAAPSALPRFLVNTLDAVAMPRICQLTVDWMATTLLVFRLPMPKPTRNEPKPACSGLRSEERRVGKEWGGGLEVDKSGA